MLRLSGELADASRLEERFESRLSLGIDGVGAAVLAARLLPLDGGLPAVAGCPVVAAGGFAGRVVLLGVVKLLLVLLSVDLLVEEKSVLAGVGTSPSGR